MIFSLGKIDYLPLRYTHLNICLYQDMARLPFSSSLLDTECLVRKTSYREVGRCSLKGLR